MGSVWATPQQVDATGVAVTAQLLAQAQDDIEIFSGRVYDDTDRIRGRDLYWLGKAVARQAAWLTEQYDVATRLDATETSQDGVSNKLTPDGAVLAPMAGKALRRCSWMRSRTVHVGAPFEGGRYVTNQLLESADDGQAWRPMP
ncbi:hypothetical protein G3I39_25105 [Streptomyces fulvissimus]|uniref:Uncharacterized protein n=1 Tax=Streptomyces microflavus TaxID=1919 RepID=A0A6N9VG91_STRMI|nr:hypothetical protein [Streptomyces microflavus]NEB70308.1 hypothetical protein [Streptomyces microflavus]NEE43188.1 hypothetical protein [Streptomyces sp. SID8455]